jgi:hypothetical protein
MNGRSRRGVGLIHMIGGLFVGGLVLSLSVPLYLTAVRQADGGVLRSRMREQARQITSRIREDVRQAASLQLASDGSGVRLTLQRPNGARDQISYEHSAQGLVRDVRPGDSGRTAEHDVWSTPLTGVTFSHSGPAVRAQLFFDQQINGRRAAFSTDCTAIPRSAL